MAFLNPVVAEGIRLVVRQAASTALSSLSSDPSATPTPTGPPASSTATASPTLSSTSSAETTANGPGPGNNGGPPGNNNNNQGNNSSPLLFFVALGFGVVFTNLWIIVGVKYCFRYNARSRQMRLNEDGEPINMENMPRPHRRRREKKLMTMDEVNEKFPMMKYKSWVASRAQEGLPTRGGVSAPPSRAASLRDEDGVVPELPSKEHASSEDRPTTSANAAATEKQTPKHAPKESTSSTVQAPPRTSTDAHLVPTISESATLSKDPNRASHDEDDEDDEHINAALPPECMGTSGDTCAICIDTLEDDDDVRGLTCGHAFHAACLDPWLTSRRACCPLCKADYYTPKPRPPAAEAGDSSSPGVIAVSLPNDGNARMNLPGRPRHAFFGIGRGGRPVPTAHYMVGNQASINSYATQPSPRSGHSEGGGGGFLSRFRRGNAAPSPTSPSAPAQSSTRSSQPQSGGLLSNFRSAFPAFRMHAQNRSRSDAPTASGANPAITPSNLEAGVRNTSS
ncbi:putative E3 ubiquitin-protein ligase RNF167 precursor [Echria macrotheca]|uniref:E3 ubiquitin-protein ligase RNF167 n=1 Tax=Echria macrotheca TaxID=438768 RepID=A0AAJ0BG46_9PEZI|nr:putative E3 ubiquitin-protein ligase RNF167 precursor [Echria macrotheca]